MFNRIWNSIHFMACCLYFIASATDRVKPRFLAKAATRLGFKGEVKIIFKAANWPVLYTNKKTSPFRSCCRVLSFPAHNCLSRYLRSNWHKFLYIRSSNHIIRTSGRHGHWLYPEPLIEHMDCISQPGIASHSVNLSFRTKLILKQLLTPTLQMHLQTASTWMF